MGTVQPLNGGPQCEITHFATHEEAVAWMRDDARSRGFLLMQGVGNDMTTPFYRACGRHAETYWPNGIPGRCIIVTYDHD